MPCPRLAPSFIGIALALVAAGLRIFLARGFLGDAWDRSRLVRPS